MSKQNLRTGLIMQKAGMTQIYNDAGERVPVTALSIGDCQVVGQRTLEKDGYNALCVGAGSAKEKRVKKPQLKAFAANNIPPKRTVAEFRVQESDLLKTGTPLKPDHFVNGQFVDVTAVSIGKGFAGSMKRHNFGGLRASHGVSVSHRSHESTGQRQDPGRVFKGKKMAGHMGARRVTVQNLKVVSIDPDNGVLLVKGAAPGPRGAFVIVRDAVKKPAPKIAPKEETKNAQKADAPEKTEEVAAAPDKKKAEVKS